MIEHLDLNFLSFLAQFSARNELSISIRTSEPFIDYLDNPSVQMVYHLIAVPEINNLFVFFMFCSRVNLLQNYGNH